MLNFEFDILWNSRCFSYTRKTMVDGFKVVIHSGVGVCTLLQNRQEDSKMGHFIFHTQIIQLVTFEKSSTDLGDSSQILFLSVVHWRNSQKLQKLI